MNLMDAPWILASDIDNTLTGDRPALDQLRHRLLAPEVRRQLFLILATGRALVHVLQGMRQEGLPQPDAIIAQVGTEIFLPPWNPESASLAAWDDILRSQFSRETALGFLQGIPGLTMQPDEYNTPLKVSCWLDRADSPDEAAAVIGRRVAAAGLDGSYRVVWSSGRDLDILPAGAGKGPAVSFLIDHLNLHSRQVVVAGDSGNDWTMFQAFKRGIVVANAQPELARLATRRSEPGIYFARQASAAGVLEGLEHFGLL
jgi:sucrose-6-phosphatase